jgi:hypothetical protein
MLRGKRQTSIEGEGPGSSEPLRPDERGEEVDDDRSGHHDRDNDHRECSLNLLARKSENQAQAHADQPEREHRGKPNDQIHRSLLTIRASDGMTRARRPSSRRLMRAFARTASHAPRRPASRASVEAPVAWIFDGERLGQVPVNFPYRLLPTGVRNS